MGFIKRLTCENYTFILSHVYDSKRNEYLYDENKDN